MHSYPVWVHDFCGNPQELFTAGSGRGTKETCTREAECVSKGNNLLVH